MRLSSYFITILICLFFISFSCNKRKSSQPRDVIIKSYIEGLNKADFKLVSLTISDSIVSAEMDFVLTKNKKELYQQFQWDSVFSPKYEILDFNSENIATISKTCNRIVFLQDSAMVYKAKIDFKDNKIGKIHTIDYIYFDELRWQSRRDTLVAWIDKHHPELSGFIYDLSKKGAENYLMAIDYYQKEKQEVLN